MRPTKKAAQDALNFMRVTMNDPEMPPETRRKCAETILGRVAAAEEEAKPTEVSVTYQVVE